MPWITEKQRICTVNPNHDVEAYCLDCRRCFDCCPCLEAVNQPAPWPGSLTEEVVAAVAAAILTSEDPEGMVE